MRAEFLTTAGESARTSPIAANTTIITTDDDSGTAIIYTSQQAVLAQLKGNPAAPLIESGSSDGREWARYEIASSLMLCQ